jgi:16S rRNA (guanine527-N7)-methyltransferase
MSDAEAGALIADAARLGVSLGAREALLLLGLLDELARWNRAYNLSAIRERSAMVRAHLLDSLAAFQDLQGKRILDAGTGAGFPGLPLAVVAPERQFTLVDAVAKKIRFVTHACRSLGLSNVEPLQARLETLAPAAPFDTILARAYAALPALLSSVAALAGPATRIVALKGRYPEAELAALPAGWRLAQARSPEIPGLAATRHILILVRAAAAHAPVVPARQRLD